MMDDHRDMLDPREAAHFLRLNVQTVRRLAREGKIPAFKAGGRLTLSERLAGPLGGIPKQSSAAKPRSGH